MAIFNEEYIYEHRNIVTKNYGYFFFFNPEFYHALSIQPKPRMTLVQILKAHEYPGYINMINNLKTNKDIDYIRTDLSLAPATYKKIAERNKLCNELGDCKTTKNYYKGIKKGYIDKGITENDAILTNNWFRTVARDALNKRAKEIRELNK